MKKFHLEMLTILFAAAVLLIPTFAISADTARATNEDTAENQQTTSENQQIASKHMGPFSELENEFVDAAGCTTIMYDLRGNGYEHDGILSASRLEECNCVRQLASYSIFNCGKCVAKISLNDINCTMSESQSGELGVQSAPEKQNGYYSINFELSSADNTEMFLTGLSQEDITSVENEIVNSITSGKDFDIERLNFIDAEKQSITGSNDSNLCWAASAADIMQYTGWTEYLNLRNNNGQVMDCDDLMDMFVSDFNDKGYYTICGIGYVLNGVDGWSDYSYRQEKPAEAGPKQSASRTIHDSKHAYDMVTVENSFSDKKDPAKIMQDQFEKLQNGWGINLNLGWLSSSESGYYGAHAITLWGYIIDKDYSAADKNRYTALVVSDSDNTPTGSKDRRTAPNRLTVNWIKPYNGTADSWKEAYGRGVVISMQDLMPYSDSIPVETDERATRNKLTTCDLVVSEMAYSDVSEGTSGTGSVFTDSQNIYVAPVISNLSEQDMTVAPNDNSTLKYNVAVYDSTGKKVLEKTQDINEISIQKHGYAKADNYACLSKLEAGTYTLKTDINSSRSLSEAFYYNNSNSTTFTVVEDPARNVSLTSTLTGYDETYGEVKLAYVDPDEYLTKDGCTYSLEISYLIDGSWTTWAEASALDENGKLQPLTDLEEAPAKAAVDKSGEKVKFRLIINDGDVSPTVYGNELSLEYSSLQIVTKGINTGVYTPLKSGSCELADGEVLACKIRNASTIDGALKCRVEIGIIINGKFEVICKQNNIELGKGEESEIISVSRWSKSNAVYETTKAYARAYYENGDKEICQKCLLGELNVQESPDTTVTTADDTDNMYDGVISLREAVKYSRQLGKPDIYVDESLRNADLMLTSPLEITSRINIHGSAECATICAKFSSSDYIIKVAEGGNLTLDYVRFKSKAHYTVYTGIIYNSGGYVHLRSCLISGISGALLGKPMIHADGGSINLQNTTITSVVFDQTMIAADNGAKLNMLNCLFCDNTGTDAVICNRGGEINAVYSTFLNNTVYKSAGAEVSAAGMQSLQNSATNAVGCIILHADSTYAKSVDLEGPIKAWGCFYGTAGEDVTADANCITGTFADAVEIDETSGLPEYMNEETGTSFWVKLPIPLKTLEGKLYLKSESGLISYSTDGSRWVKTDVDAAFASEYYELDILGKTHNGYLGCYSPTGTTPAHKEDPSSADDKDSSSKQQTGSSSQGTDTGDNNAIKLVLMLLFASMATAGLCLASPYIGIKIRKLLQQFFL